MDSLYVRYSNALLSLAKEENKVTEYKDAIKSLLSFFDDNKEVLDYLKSYFETNEAKYDIADNICKAYNLQNLSSFIKLLIKRHHIHEFKYIANEFIKESNESLGIYEGLIYSTETLSEAQIKSIEESVSKKLNQKVELKNKIDTRLIGGIKVVIHDHVFDGSLSHKLETLKTKLNERRNAKWKLILQKYLP